MTHQSTFQNLARSIPEKERKELLEKITRSLSIRSNSEDSIHRAIIPEEERAATIEREIASLGVTGRIRLWFRCFLSGKPKEKVYVSIRLQRIRNRIHRHHPGLISFDVRSFTPRFADRIYSLYESVYLFIPFFKEIWSDASFFEGMILYILGTKIKSPKNETTDMLPMEELKRIFLLTERKEDLRNEILHSLNSYIQSIPSGVFEEIEQRLLPFYYLQELVLFPFGEIFAAFQVSFPYGEHPDAPEFKQASEGLIIDSLERLYYAMYVVQKIPQSMYFFQEVFDYRKTIHPDDPSITKESIHAMRDGLRKCRDAVGDFLKKVPLSDIIRYFRDDPYYRMMFYLPNLKLKEFYQSSLKIRILAEFEMVFNAIRQNVTEDLVGEIFRNEPLDELRFYTYHPEFPWKKLGLRFFSHITSLRVLYTFLVRNFRREIRPLLDRAGKKVVSRKRDLQSHLLLNAGVLEDLTDKIKTFDYSLAPESDDGKTFARIRYSLESDLSQVKTYEILLVQKDREAKELIDKGMEYLDGLLRGIEEVRIIFHGASLKKAPSEDEVEMALLEKGLVEQTDMINRFKKLLLEVRSLDVTV